LDYFLKENSGKRYFQMTVSIWVTSLIEWMFLQTLNKHFLVSLFKKKSKKLEKIELSKAKCSR